MSASKDKKALDGEKAVNIFIVGVGGQGVIAASEIICDAALRAGLEAKKSEVHGMSQRGGVVTSHVRVGTGVTSPIISDGDADVILAFELAEALRWMHFVKPGGAIIVNNQKIVPPIAFTLGLKYPDESGFERAKERGIRLTKLDAYSWASELGDPRFVNTLLTGLLSALPEMSVIPEKSWVEAIKEQFARKMADENVNAFEKGRNYIKTQSK
jgi:indolepyruvate ferredoxin oxidoreductase, beta subunit